ncbi:MAG: DUF3151 domain-containing protein [Corynebacterium sp.]|uniref:DUF3151 domain-containing protein n=1 Tax=Corynebacterium sp. TaxID=1720 RepID=UPI0026DFDFCD|nr:DUF3151 domain-containing protein [Corynebacterium sp.]MDO5670151.1 DUF3151 domain-containing protein [Corynebacterium sp.]
MKINDMMAPPPVHLPADPAADADPAAADTAFAHPDSPLVWATRAEMLLAAGSLDDVAKLTAYAHARTAYHRSLDRLRANGWKGWGPVPFSHEPNQAVLRAIAALARAARLIGEDGEYDRCRQMLSDADPESVSRLIDSV